MITIASTSSDIWSAIKDLLKSEIGRIPKTGLLVRVDGEFTRDDKLFVHTRIETLGLIVKSIDVYRSAVDELNRMEILVFMK